MSGDYIGEYAAPPPNVHLESWYPQPAVIPEVDLFIHHGGNNSFNEALYFGKPAIIMPYCWDGLDNAARITDTGYGADLPRYKWTDRELASTIERLLADKKMAKRLQALSRHMQKAQGHRQGRGSDSESDGEGSMSASSAPHIKEAAKAAGLTEWGPQPDAIEGQSISSGKLLWKRDEGGRAHGGGRALGLHPRLLAALAARRRALLFPRRAGHLYRA